LLSKDSTGVDLEDGLPMRSIIRRIFLRDQASADALLSMKGSLSYGQLMHAAYWLKSGKDTKLALEFAREAASPRFTADERAAALAHVALLSIARGQKRSAVDALRQARSLRPVDGAAYAAVVGMSAGALPDERTMREDLEAVDGLPRLHDPLDSDGVDFDVAGTEGSIALARLALRAQILARMGLSPRVESACRDLESFSGTDLERRWANYYAIAARAALAWNQNDPRATLEQLEKAPLVAQPSARKALRSNQNERFLRGEALRALGRDTDALAWYRGLNELFWWDTSYATIAALRCAELDEKQGHPDSAIRYYREALDNLADCDPEYLPWRTLAESGAKRLSAVSKARP
jgi:tetratricopeptide (TPR) repeat protein